MSLQRSLRLIPAVALLGLSLSATAEPIAPSEHARLQAEREGPIPPMALGVKLGTLGLSGDVTLGMYDTLNVRGTFNVLGFSYEDTVDSTDYDVDVDMMSFGALLDWHCFKNGFRFSGGIFVVDNAATLDATFSDSIDLGDTRYPKNFVTDLRGEMVFDSVAPYIGIGYGNAVVPDGKWSFAFDLGVLIQSYDVSLTAEGPATLLPGLEEDLRAEEQQIEDELNQLNVYPVLSFGLARKF